MSNDLTLLQKNCFKLIILSKKGEVAAEIFKWLIQTEKKKTTGTCFELLLELDCEKRK